MRSICDYCEEWIADEDAHKIMGDTYCDDCLERDLQATTEAELRDQELSDLNE